MKIRVVVGMLYLAKSHTGEWFLIQQVSMKQWLAMNFTHPYFYGDVQKDGFDQTVSFQCNGGEMSNMEWKEVHGFAIKTSKVPFRKAMFNILKFGKIEGEDQ